MNRKLFIKKSLILSGVSCAVPTIMLGQKDNQEKVFEAELIREFVFAAHKSFDETKKIIEKYPLLLNCTNQGKKGDFETAVGGASHMGRRDIADLLVAKGARLDIFNYAFLGYDNFVKKLVSDHPQLLKAPGPHGFTLLHHAKVGNRNALADWLRAQGLIKTFFKGSFG